MAKKTLLNIKTYEFLATQYAESGLGYKTQKQIADAFGDNPAFHPIVELAKQHQQITSTYFAGNEKNTKTRHALDLEQNKLALRVYDIISHLITDQQAVIFSNKIISDAKRYHINEIKKVLLIGEQEQPKHKYIATIVDLSSRATTAIDISLEAFGYKGMIEHLIKEKKVPNIRDKYKVNRYSNDISKLHDITKKANSCDGVISDIKTILHELYRVYSGILNSRLGIE